MRKELLDFCLLLMDVKETANIFEYTTVDSHYYCPIPTKSVAEDLHDFGIVTRNMFVDLLHDVKKVSAVEKLGKSHPLYPLEKALKKLDQRHKEVLKCLHDEPAVALLSKDIVENMLCNFI